jgi:hypothetical protein
MKFVEGFTRTALSSLHRITYGWTLSMHITTTAAVDNFNVIDSPRTETERKLPPGILAATGRF